MTYSPSPSCIIEAADQHARFNPARLRGRGLDIVRRCGHDSISAAIIQACFELDLQSAAASPSSRGIAASRCDLFLGASHGFTLRHAACPRC